MTEQENNPHTTNEGNNEPATPAHPLSPAWLWTARIAAGLPPLSLVAILVYEVASNPTQLGALGLLLPLLIISLPYLQILNTLRGEVQKHRVRLGVVWASLTTLSAALLLLLLFREEPELSYWSAAMYFGAAFALVQPFLLLSTTVLYFKLERRKLAGRERLAATGSLIFYGVVFLTLAIVIPNTLRSTDSWNSVMAVGSIRLLVNCAVHYQTVHPNVGFPRNIRGVGPVAGGGDGCIDSALTNAANGGPPKTGYTFTYTPGEPNEEGVIETFTVTAVPARCGRTGVRTYFADETGVFRFTNREAYNCPVADANSPPL